MSELTREGIVAALREEQCAVEALLGRISDEQWSTLARPDGWTIHDIVAHIGDVAFGAGRLALQASQQPPAGPLPRFDEIMAFINRRNDERRPKLAKLSRADIEGRIASGFAETIKLVDQVGDLQAPAAGPASTVGGMLMAAAQHSSGHRQEIEQLLG